MQYTSRTRRWALGFALAVGAVGLAASSAWAVSGELFPKAVTPIAEELLPIQQLVLGILIGIFVLVELAILYAVVMFRHKEGRQPATFHGNTTLEIVWTVIPALLLVVMSVPAYKAMTYMRAQPVPDVAIEVVGHQWWWEYRYPNDKVQVLDNQHEKDPKPMVVPINKIIGLTLTSNDVIHSFYIPHFGLKQDANPGHIDQAWFMVKEPGLYKGQCAELCGSMHAKMFIEVKAVTDAEYKAWVKTAEKLEGPSITAPKEDEHAAAPATGKGDASPGPDHGAPAGKWDMDTAMAKGKSVYNSRCLSCHQATGEGVPGAFPPLAGAEQVTGDVKEHAKIVLNGLTGKISVKGQEYNGVMPPWGAVLSDEEVAAVVTYERNSWGNKGGLVKPEDVKALR